MESLRVDDGGARTGETGDVPAMMRGIGRAARLAQRALANAAAETVDRALVEAADAVRRSAGAILDANARDLAAARDLGPAARDRLTLDPDRVKAVARSLEDIAELPCPVGRILASFDRPNGLTIERVSTPLGVVGVIYESRPNVTADAGALCLKAGNVVDAARRVRQPATRLARAARLPRRGACEAADLPEAADLNSCRRADRDGRRRAMLAGP